MFTTRLTHSIIFAFALGLTSVHADHETRRKESDELNGHLHYVHQAYVGSRLDAWCKSYKEFVLEFDIDAWKSRIKDEGDEKRRKSFLAEYFAYSRDYELVRVQGFDLKPVTTSKHRLSIILFHPGRPISDVDPPSDKLKSTVYMIIRKEVPADEDNPYAIMLSRAFRGYSTQQLRSVVETYRKEW